MARYVGRRADIMLAPDGTSAAVHITAAKWTLDSAKADIDLTMFLDNNMVTGKGLPNFKGAFNGVFDDTETTVFAAAEVDASVRMYLYPDKTNLATRYWYGFAYVDYNVDADVKDKVAVAGTWVAGGTWARK